MKQDRRGSWYLLTGIIIGIAFGLLYSWIVNPVKYIDAPPYSLREDYKEQYRALVALAYMNSNDLLRAQDRLSQLKDNNIAQTISMQAQQALAEGHSEEEVRALSLLASALSKGVVPNIVEPMLIPNSTLTPTVADDSQAILITTPSEEITSTVQASDIPDIDQQTPIP